ncbi:MAG TPA: 1-deoxy-D-xylulose-5-phosphate synthase [Anaerohalosphaeraceae bacterium]|jgi:1-deoxy-D-xylulose-5-phosphate synthase|nr:1-deoxy-D-xylulose-5-phosphate synthase [Anaerohalosphaeraceae bacterium]HRT50510.1 1-deoxy-D-xylulose-5-phosphate synthase [Anaerohalosphaeraceae bacterium]HRT86440.1 1-deoxy-D-xylulose-5-phosphate synthase [Anaerohalosphaeraceae bacterium]
MAKLLDNVNRPEDLRQLSMDQLKDLADEIRELITHSVSQTGGHLASNLGIVELTIALHYVFDFKTDRLLWDVGHQCYAHKILTGRKERFSRLRRRGGISGFPNPAESEYDVFSVGHAGTSIATALGMALGAQHNGTDEKIVAVVGDASIVNGLSFEALNNLGLVKRQMLIVLNDNSMAIDVTQGAIAKFLSKVRLSHTYDDLRRTTNAILEHLPVIGRRMEDALENFKKAVRMAISPSRLFESLNIPYFGPVDGHDIASLIKLFKAMSELQWPAILHVYTRKGKGFTPADDNPRKFHSTGPFEINGQAASLVAGRRTYTEAFGEAIVEAAEADDRIITITAAMPDGTGLARFREKFPDRCYDVGIAESVAVDAAAGLAKQGFRPVVCIYSTFLQRSFDQIFQEVALQNLPIVFCIDRGGLVGDDGPTHHGLLDIGFLRMLPNMVLISPASEYEIKEALAFALKSPSPVAIRYPRDTVPNGQIEAATSQRPFVLGKSITIRRGRDSIVIAALGSILAEALSAAETLADNNIDVTVVNARFAKPVDRDLVDMVLEGKHLVTVEDHGIAAGFGSAALEAVADAAAQRTDAETMQRGTIITLGGPDCFIDTHSRSAQLDEIGISAGKIVAAVQKLAAAINNQTLQKSR